MGFALVDANNFYASCETLFRPDLRHRPVIVLSNNDGCVIARNKPAKALGLKMGMPYFQIKAMIRQHGISVFSSNYPLYADMSNRLMTTLAHLTPRIEVYSIDECFVDTTGLKDLAVLGQHWQQTIQQWTGLTVGIGFAPTKTLAKLANYAAKHYPKTGGVVDLSDRQRQIKLMKITPVGEVWGVGRKLDAALQSLQIHTAYDLAQCDIAWMRKRFGLQLAKTINELNNIPCIALEENPPTKKQIRHARSFGQSVYDYDSLSQAISHFACRAAEKLRQENQRCYGIRVFLRSSPHREHFVRVQQQHQCITATNDSRTICMITNNLLKRLYVKGVAYKKAGVLLYDFEPTTMVQPSLFACAANDDNLMQTLDKINKTKGQLMLARQLPRGQGAWTMSQNNLSPRYTTHWADLMRVK